MWHSVEGQRRVALQNSRLQFKGAAKCTNIMCEFSLQYPRYWRLAGLWAQIAARIAKTRERDALLMSTVCFVASVIMAAAGRTNRHSTVATRAA